MPQTKIILFNGPPRSGKDTATKLMLEIIYGSERDGVNRRSAYHYRFAEPLKDAVHALFGMSGILTEHFDAVKGTPCNQMMSMTPRQAYIWLSEEVAKPKFGDDFFAKVAINHLKQFEDAAVVISDFGFQVEVDTLVKHFGEENIMVVYLMRDGANYNDDSRRYIEHNPNYCRAIYNNGTVEDLKVQIKKNLGGFINE